MKWKVFIGSVLGLGFVIGLIEIWSYWSYDVSHQLGVAHFKGETTDEMVRALESLNDPQAPLGEVVQSLEVLGKSGHPRARLESLKLSDAKTASQRQAAAVGLGFYTDPRANKNLIKLLSDSSVDVRLKAIDALGTVPLKAREKIVRKILKKKTLEDHEKIMVYRSLYRITKDDKTKTEAIDQIRMIAKDPKTSSRGVAVRTLLEWNQDVGDALQWARDTIRSRISRPEDLVEAIKILRKNPGEFDKIPWEDLMKHPAETVRLEMVVSLTWICPKERWRALKEIADIEQDTDVLRAIVRVVSDLSEPYSKTFLLDFTESGKAGAYQPDVTSYAEEWLRRTQESKESPRCR